MLLSLTGTGDTSHEAALDERYTLGRDIQGAMALGFRNTSYLRPPGRELNGHVEGRGRVVVDSLCKSGKLSDLRDRPKDLVPRTFGPPQVCSELPEQYMLH